MIRVKLPFTFWSLDGVIFQCRQKYLNTVIYKCFSSNLLLFHVQNPRTNWVSVVWKLGEICYSLKYLKLVFFQQLIQRKLLYYKELKCVYIVSVFHEQTTLYFNVQANYKCVIFGQFHYWKEADMRIFKLCPISKKIKAVETFNVIFENTSL